MRDGEGGSFAFGARRNQPLLAVDFVLQIGLIRSTSDGNGPQLESGLIALFLPATAGSGADAVAELVAPAALDFVVAAAGRFLGCFFFADPDVMGAADVDCPRANSSDRSRWALCSQDALCWRRPSYRDVHLLLLVVILQSESGILRVLNLSSRDSGALSGRRRTL